MPRGGHVNTEPPPPDEGGPSTAQLVAVLIGAIAAGLVTYLALLFLVGGWVAFAVGAVVGVASGWLLDSRFPSGSSGT